VADRPDPVALLERQGQGRVAELLPIRYGRMLASPFAFFRGAALLMARDLSGTPVTGLTVQACGDAHLSNYRRTLEWDRRFLISKYHVVDMARKVVGIGSVGMRCWVVLLTGRDPEDRLFLQVKEAVPSVLSGFIGPSPYPSQGERVVAGLPRQGAGVRPGRRPVRRDLRGPERT
jgi:uncharacterized protein (DUF2252 family)